MRGILGVVVVVWLLVGVLASWQRGYLQNAQTNCATAGTIAVTIVSGPLNYFGVNPKVTDCRLPEPSAMATVRHLSPQEMEWS
ncbi:hypothetical protein H7J07_18515 [Mycobacterium koreense]|uniref:Uncharacterized protein n=1 Tax=Mycolicibacillus koreensis TaxID=1069220 RepID=A0A7I7SFR3_9MYCO|nr:hypothetical protein [Mycolicibacillus koreensis]MCV7250188.1 hypothetical protein [Mycolicibacillus koreensis]ODR11172.1 hypothetical protein BHQ15_03465 [Mycolicibacillus koreensis]OSC33271.1 hypothetical protein B8W67_11710 [Mycolicibacillus koreensis]BBY54835.1 hypothetical protein MKOR_20860 [Mycolicibacillus koreensis]